MVSVNLIVARNLNRVIGNEGKIPWHIPEDLKRFKVLTDGGIVIMGRKTWESLPNSIKPLSNRLNVVISNQNRDRLRLPKEVLLYDSVFKAMRELLLEERNIWFIGGSQIYVVGLPYCQYGYITVVNDSSEGDTILDKEITGEEIENEFHPEGQPSYRFTKILLKHRHFRIYRNNYEFVTEFRDGFKLFNTLKKREIRDG